MDPARIIGPMLRRLGLASSLLLIGCMQNGGHPAPTAPFAKQATAEHRGPSAAPKEELPWATFSPATFAKAKAEKKYIVMDGAAEWCHWCHVMEATTYHDPEVRKLLDEHFIAVKVDIDSRPDLEERYGEYGWPATVMFSPDASEIGKYRGYIAPDKFVEILKEIVASGIAENGSAAAPKAVVKAPRTPLSEEHLAWIEAFVDRELDDFYDEEEGGWGRSQKAAVATDNAWTLWKAGHGNELAKKKALFTLEKQSQLLDPVFGGLYQYSAAKDWGSPHFEKLMTFQAPAIDNYAQAYALTKDPKQLARARSLQGYVDRFMKGPEGGFFTTQDADLNAHDRNRAFMDGHDYYRLDEKGRLAAGIPRIDTHEYAKENGFAIAAYCTLYDATKDDAVLASAEKAAARIMATHALRGGYAHDRIDPEHEQTQLFLGDNASFGFGLMRLYESTKKPEYLAKAKSLADAMLSELADDDGGGLFASSRDPNAVGIFATRRVPFEENVLALRFLARVAHDSKDAKYKQPIDRILRALSDPGEIKGRGRWLGDYLLALEETKGVR